MAARGEDISMVAGCYWFPESFTVTSVLRVFVVAVVVVVVVVFHASGTEAGKALGIAEWPISIQDKKTNSNLKMLAVNSLVAGAGREECRVGGGYRLDPDIRFPGWLWIVNVGSDCRELVTNKQLSQRPGSTAFKGGNAAFLGARRIEKEESKARSPSWI